MQVAVVISREFALKVWQNAASETPFLMESGDGAGKPSCPNRHCLARGIIEKFCHLSQ